jgi:hypothetical protein
MNRFFATAAPVFVLALGACHSMPARPTFTDQDYPGKLRPPSALPSDVVWQQRVTAIWGQGAERGFDAAVQKRGDTLTVMGLSPLGSLGFAVVLRGDAIEVQAEAQAELPFPPRFILLDVQRAFYPWLPAAQGADGERQAEVDGEVVHERWADGRLRERSFHRVSGGPEGSIVLTYEWGHADWTGPSRVVLDNGWFGYRLIVDTQVETLLAGGGGSF